METCIAKNLDENSHKSCKVSRDQYSARDVDSTRDTGEQLPNKLSQIYHLFPVTVILTSDGIITGMKVCLKGPIAGHGTATFSLYVNNVQVIPSIIILPIGLNNFGSVTFSKPVSQFDEVAVHLTSSITGPVEAELALSFEPTQF